MNYFFSLINQKQPQPHSCFSMRSSGGFATGPPSRASCDIKVNGWTVENLTDLIQLVVKLNNELDEQDYVEISFWLTTDGDSAGVELVAGGLEAQLWDSRGDEREQLPPPPGRSPNSLIPPEYECLEGFLRRRAQEILGEIADQAGYVKLQEPKPGEEPAMTDPACPKCRMTMDKEGPSVWNCIGCGYRLSGH